MARVQATLPALRDGDPEGEVRPGRSITWSLALSYIIKNTIHHLSPFFIITILLHHHHHHHHRYPLQYINS